VANVRYRITGIGRNESLEYFKDDLAEAAYLARKMADNGVDEVRVFDSAGNEIDITDAPLPPGWRKGPFKKSDFDF
jgi:hypothetical protein